MRNANSVAIAHSMGFVPKKQGMQMKKGCSGYWKNTAPGLYEGRALNMANGGDLLMQVFIRKLTIKYYIQVYNKGEPVKEIGRRDELLDAVTDATNALYLVPWIEGRDK